MTEAPTPRQALQKAAETFDRYESLHAAKGSIEGDQKARANARMAGFCRAALPGLGGLYDELASLKWSHRLIVARVAALLAAIKPFVDEANRIDPDGPDPSIGDGCEIWQCGGTDKTRSKITYGDLRQARQALVDDLSGQSLESAAVGQLFAPAFTRDQIVGWLLERLRRCRRIADTKHGADRIGWLDDASKFAQAMHHLQHPPPPIAVIDRYIADLNHAADNETDRDKRRDFLAGIVAVNQLKERLTDSDAGGSQ